MDVPTAPEYGPDGESQGGSSLNPALLISEQAHRVSKGEINDCEAMGVVLGGLSGIGGAVQLADAFRMLTPADPRIPSSLGVAVSGSATLMRRSDTIGHSGYQERFRENEKADQGHHFALFSRLVFD
jgi:hypothetical protein